MTKRASGIFALALTLPLIAGFTSAAELGSIADLQAKAEKQHVLLAAPTFERTVEEINASGDSAIREADAALDRIAKQDTTKLTFENTVRALDDVVARVRNTGSRLGLLQETLPDKTLRDTASDVNVKLQTWGIALEYREDIYRVIKAYADTSPRLANEEKLLFDETLRDYRRAGLALRPEERAEVERLRKQLAQLTTEFTNHINEARGPLDLTAAELEGVPPSFLDSPGVRQADGTYRVMLNITWHAEAILENAKSEDVRRRAYFIRSRLAQEKNVPLMAQMVAVRTDIAHRLGYKDWADYQTEPRMAKTGDAAVKFEEELVTGLQQKFTTEVATLQKLKVEETKSPDAKLQPWDVQYYTDKLKKQRYAVDTEQLRVYFPYQQVLEGMFRIYERIFGLTFTEVAPPQVWAPGVKLFAVTDAASGTPMGLFYLDMFPREGKYNHFACFPISDGALRLDGVQETPVASLVCNFPPPSADHPSLLKHEDVETLFHEFGHVMHMVLSRAKYARHSAFGVPQDFVEAPSQMLENWPWDKKVLDTFAADYRDPSKKVPAEVIEALKRARVATAGMYYRRQLAFGLLDLALHTQQTPNPNLDVVKLTNDVLARVSVAPPSDTAFIAYFGHLAGGYDAGYYGYLWSLAIAQDMASVFQASPQGFLDPTIGRRLRDEIYAAGASRDVAESVERFLGRKQSTKPFLKFLGVEEAK